MIVTYILRKQGNVINDVEKISSMIKLPRLRLR